MNREDTEQEMETISKELDKCESRRIVHNRGNFWKQMVYVVAGVNAMAAYLFLIG